MAFRPISNPCVPFQREERSPFSHRGLSSERCRFIQRACAIHSTTPALSSGSPPVAHSAPRRKGVREYSRTPLSEDVWFQAKGGTACHLVAACGRHGRQHARLLEVLYVHRRHLPGAAKKQHPFDNRVTLFRHRFQILASSAHESNSISYACLAPSSPVMWRRMWRGDNPPPEQRTPVGRRRIVPAFTQRVLRRRRVLRRVLRRRYLVQRALRLLT